MTHLESRIDGKPADSCDLIRAMNTAAETLPDDVAALRAMLLTAWAERDAERAERQQIDERDSSPGRTTGCATCSASFSGCSSAGARRSSIPTSSTSRWKISNRRSPKPRPSRRRPIRRCASARAEKRRAGRGSLPEHLPRVEVVIEPEDTACPCCGGAMQVIGEDRSQRLDVIPAQYQVIVTRRPKYACRACQEAVVQAPAPARLIEGGLPTERLVAHVLVAKYADHCPLYRQCQILARQGIAIDRVGAGVLGRLCRRRGQTACGG